MCFLPLSLPPGAGWGGCTVSLVNQDRVGPFMQQLTAKYFAPLLEKGTVTGAEMPEVSDERKDGCARARWSLLPSRAAMGAARRGDAQRCVRCEVAKCAAVDQLSYGVGCSTSPCCCPTQACAAGFRSCLRQCPTCLPF